jgi:hypothetical protein
MEPAAGVAILHQVRQHGAARVVVSHRGTTLEPDLQPHMAVALRELRGILAAADQPLGPSKADTIARALRVFEVLPPDVRALVVPQ